MYLRFFSLTYILEKKIYRIINKILLVIEHYKFFFLKNGSEVIIPQGTKQYSL
jgi:hypothetical protein